MLATAKLIAQTKVMNPKTQIYAQLAVQMNSDVEMVDVFPAGLYVTEETTAMT